MKTICLRNMSLLLKAAGPVHAKVPWTPYPQHWRSGQRESTHSLGAQLKRRRLELHLFQADLAKTLGVSAVSISNWERGATQPSGRIQRKICNLLKQPPA